MPALDFRACTHARMHTCLFAAMVARMQHLYSNARVLTPAQWPAPRLRGQECNCHAPPCLHSFTSAPTPGHPRLVRTAENSAMLQKWHNRTPFVRCHSRCTVGRSWLRTPAAGSAQLKNEPTQGSACSQGSLSVSASAGEATQRERAMHPPHSCSMQHEHTVQRPCHRCAPLSGAPARRRPCNTSTSVACRRCWRMKTRAWCWWVLLRGRATRQRRLRLPGAVHVRGC